MGTETAMCVLCAWRRTCNKKFSVDGTTTTKCPEYTKDVTLEAPATDKPETLEKQDGGD
jgi:hypothetical protein